MLEREDRRIEGKQEGSAQMDRAFFFPVFIARPENNAKNSAPQSVNYCVTDFRRTPVRLQICSLQFALCSTAFFALFSGLAIGDKVFHCVFREEFLKLTIQLCCKCFIVRYDQGWLSPINKAKTICIWIRVSFDASSNSFTCSKVYVLVSSAIIV